MVRPDSFPMFLIASGITSNHILLRRPLHFVEKKALKTKITKLSDPERDANALTRLDANVTFLMGSISMRGVGWGRKRLAMELEGGRSKGQSKICFRHISTISAGTFGRLYHIYFGLSIGIDLNRIR
jgi:hypothetical protein